MNREKTFTQSKKFVFAFYGVLILAGLAIAGFITQTASAVAMMPVYLSIVLTIGFVVLGVVLGQAVLDKYIRIAEITVGKDGKKEEEKSDDKADTEPTQ